VCIDHPLQSKGPVSSVIPQAKGLLLVSADGEESLKWNFHTRGLICHRHNTPKYYRNLNQFQEFFVDETDPYKTVCWYNWKKHFKTKQKTCKSAAVSAV